MMLRGERHIRLTAPEIARFEKITGFVPDQVKTLADLDAYIARCKRHYWGVSRDTRFLHWLMDRERERCLDASLDPACRKVPASG